MFKFVLLDIIDINYPHLKLPVYVDIVKGISVERLWFDNQELFNILKNTLESYPILFRNEVDCDLIVQNAHHSLKNMEQLLEELYKTWEKKEENRLTRLTQLHERIYTIFQSATICIYVFMKFTYYYYIRPFMSPD